MQLVAALRENSGLSSQLSHLQLNSKSQRDLFSIQQSNSIAKLSQELENSRFRAQKLEVEVEHYKKIYGELTHRYNREKSARHLQSREGPGPGGEKLGKRLSLANRENADLRRELERLRSERESGERAKERERRLLSAQTDFQRERLAMQTENKELRGLVDFYKTQYLNRQNELTSLLDENSRLYTRLQRCGPLTQGPPVRVESGAAASSRSAPRSPRARCPARRSTHTSFRRRLCAKRPSTRGPIPRASAGSVSTPRCSRNTLCGGRTRSLPGRSPASREAKLTPGACRWGVRGSPGRSPWPKATAKRGTDSLRRSET